MFNKISYSPVSTQLGLSASKEGYPAYRISAVDKPAQDSCFGSRIVKEVTTDEQAVATRYFSERTGDLTDKRKKRWLSRLNITSPNGQMDVRGKYPALNYFMTEELAGSATLQALMPLSGVSALAYAKKINSSIEIIPRGMNATDIAANAMLLQILCGNDLWKKRPELLFKHQVSLFARAKFLDEVLAKQGESIDNPKVRKRWAEHPECLGSYIPTVKTNSENLTTIFRGTPSVDLWKDHPFVLSSNADTMRENCEVMALESITPADLGLEYWILVNRGTEALKGFIDEAKRSTKGDITPELKEIARGLIRERD